MRSLRISAVHGGEVQNRIGAIMVKNIVTFIRNAFSNNGTPSSSRLLAGATVASTLMWVTYLVFKNGQLPDLTSAAVFIAAGFSGFGVSKLSEAINPSTNPTPKP